MPAFQDHIAWTRRSEAWYDEHTEMLIDNRQEPVVADFHQLATSPLLRKWVNPRYLESAAVAEIHAILRSRPTARYAILDDFFDRGLFAELCRRHKQLHFKATDLRAPFDSQLVGGLPGVHFGSELFFDRVWQAYISALVKVPVVCPGATHVMMRRHRPYAHGIWLHTDHNVAAPVTSGVFIYLNQGWTAADGGVLQFWRREEHCGTPHESSAPIRWAGKKGKRLLFLVRRRKLFVEVGNADNRLEAMRFTLADQILPLYNRLVICDFVSDPAYHSVTPTNARPRYDITQRLY
jgi:hypothetical protein